MDNDYFGIIPAIIRYDKNLSPIDKLVYCDIQARANSKGVCWPSNKTIGESLGIDKRSVTRSISRLEKAGYISINEADNATHRTLNPRHDSLHHRQDSLPHRQDSLPPTTGESTPHRLVSLPKDTEEKNIKEEYKDTQPHAVAGDGDFDRFWKVYPKKKQKENARKAFKKMKSKMPDIETMISILEKQKQNPDWVKENGRYIPHPATWINAGSWDDEIFEPVEEVSVIQYTDPLELKRQEHIRKRMQWFRTTGHENDPVFLKIMEDEINAIR